MAEFMPDMLSDWGWLVFAAILAGLELIAPGIFMMWLALAAALTGVLTFALGFGWEVQLVVFAVLSVVAVVVGRKLLIRHPIQSDDTGLNRRGDRLVGEVVTVIEPIRHGRGRVQIADSPWTARGPDAELGTQVRIVSVKSAEVHVEPA